VGNGVNRVVLIGNVTKDPEVRQAGSTPVCTIRLACNERQKKGDEWVDHAEFVDVVCWGKTATNVGEYVRRGKQLYVEGKLRTREYEKDGQKRYRTEVNADQVLFLGGGEGERKGSGGGSRPVAETSVPSDPFLDDDLRF
jgi:single-strand DNA-binding protein